MRESRPFVATCLLLVACQAPAKDGQGGAEAKATPAQQGGAEAKATPAQQQPPPQPAQKPERPPAKPEQPPEQRPPEPPAQHEARREEIARLEREARGQKPPQQAKERPEKERPEKERPEKERPEKERPEKVDVQEVVVRANGALAGRQWRDYGACFSPPTQRLLGLELIAYLGQQALVREGKRDPTNAKALWTLIASHGIGRDELLLLLRANDWDAYVRQLELLAGQITDPAAVFDLIPDVLTWGLNVLFLGNGALTDVEPSGRGWLAIARSNGRRPLPVEVRSGRALTVHLLQAQYLEGLRMDRDGKPLQTGPAKPRAKAPAQPEDAAPAGEPRIDVKDPRQEVVTRANIALRDGHWGAYAACFTPQTQRLLAFELVLYLGGQARRAEQKKDAAGATRLWGLLEARGVDRATYLGLSAPPPTGWDDIRRRFEAMAEKIKDPAAALALIPEALKLGLETYFLMNGALADITAKDQGWTALGMSQGRIPVRVEVREVRPSIHMVHILREPYFADLRKDVEQASKGR